MSDEQKPTVVPPADSKLEGLSAEAKAVLNNLIKRGYGSKKIKDHIEAKFLLDNQNVLPASRNTYESYMAAHRPDLLKELELEHEMSDTVVDGISQMGDLADAILDSKLDVGEQLRRMKDLYVSRIAVIQEEQGRGILSANLESTLSTYMRGLTQLLELIQKYEKERDEEFKRKEMLYWEELLRKFISRTILSYKEIHGESRLDDFISAFSPRLKSAIKEFSLEKLSEDKPIQQLDQNQ